MVWLAVLFSCVTLGKNVKVMLDQYIFKTLRSKKKLKQVQNTKNLLKLFWKSFKIDYNKDPKKAKKKKIGPKGSLP